MRALNLDPKNQIHPTAWIEEGAVLGIDNYIGPFCYIGSNVKIGNKNCFSGHISIGMAAEHREYFHKEGEIVIGSNNMVREFVTINSSTKGITRIGNHCVMLRGSHLSHDSVLEDQVNVSCSVLIGGESHIMEGANLGLGSIIHQRQVIGSYVMLGMGSVVPKKLDVVPGYIYVGNPARQLKLNTIALNKLDISMEDLKMEVDRYEHLRVKISRGFQ